MRACYNCGAQQRANGRVPFKELCPECEAFLHCCRNCRLYSSAAHNHCLSSTTEFVPDVERGNFCDEFEFREIEQPAKKGAEAARVRPVQPEHDRTAPADPRGLSAREKFDRLFNG